MILRKVTHSILSHFSRVLSAITPQIAEISEEGIKVRTHCSMIAVSRLNSNSQYGSRSTSLVQNPEAKAKANRDKSRRCYYKYASIIIH